jgi:hypothetical protein
LLSHSHAGCLAYLMTLLLKLGRQDRSKVRIAYYHCNYGHGRITE